MDHTQEWAERYTPNPEKPNRSIYECGYKAGFDGLGYAIQWNGPNQEEWQQGIEDGIGDAETFWTE